MKKLTQASILGAHGATAAAGRCYLCLGPMCWGKASTAAKAVANAKSNWSRHYNPTFAFILYDAPADAYVDEMGYIRWADGEQKLTELARYNVPQAK